MKMKSFTPWDQFLFLVSYGLFVGKFVFISIFSKMRVWLYEQEANFCTFKYQQPKHIRSNSASLKQVPHHLTYLWKGLSSAGINSPAPLKNDSCQPRPRPRFTTTRQLLFRPSGGRMKKYVIWQHTATWLTLWKMLPWACRVTNLKWWFLFFQKTSFGKHMTQHYNNNMFYL